MSIDSNYIPQTSIRTIGIDEIIGHQMQSYSILLLVVSSVILIYVLWNNFVRSPSKPKKFKNVLDDSFNPENLKNSLWCDEGVEPSIKVKIMSRALDEYMIVPALIMFYISLSYYLSIRG